MWQISETQPHVRSLRATPNPHVLKVTNDRNCSASCTVSQAIDSCLYIDMYTLAYSVNYHNSKSSMTIVSFVETKPSYPSKCMQHGTTRPLATPTRAPCSNVVTRCRFIVRWFQFAHSVRLRSTYLCIYACLDETKPFIEPTRAMCAWIVADVQRSASVGLQNVRERDDRRFAGATALMSFINHHPAQECWPKRTVLWPKAPSRPMVQSTHQRDCANSHTRVAV
eukprot:SAG31_NODE_2737_length_5157_cov_7.756869_5_plen_224_part_00